MKASYHGSANNKKQMVFKSANNINIVQYWLNCVLSIIVYEVLMTTYTINYILYILILSVINRSLINHF